MLCLVGMQVYDKYIEIIKDRRKYSNIYFSLEELYNLCRNNEIEAYEKKDMFILIKKQEFFCELYYLCNSWQWFEYLDRIKRIYPNIIINIIKKNSNEEDIFLDYKMYSYKIYQRLRKISIDTITEKVKNVNFCIEGDEKELREIILDTFDMFTDKIPTSQELKIFIRQKNIICMRNKFRIKGFIIFEDKRESSYIRMVCINRDCRGEGIGDNLMHQYLGMHRQFKNFTLWYDIDNIPAFNLYKKWGYMKENMFDFIYLL